ncbi:MAG: adenylyl-sulfate kinase, partial [Allobranchiibius sp.]
VRVHHESAGTIYREVYVSTPLSICQHRDVKGLYARAAAGSMTSMTGVDDPYEPPENPDLTIDTDRVDLSVAVAALQALSTTTAQTSTPDHSESEVA